jgi:hypothetical protein
VLVVKLSGINGFAVWDMPALVQLLNGSGAAEAIALAVSHIASGEAIWGRVSGAMSGR